MLSITLACKFKQERQDVYSMKAELEYLFDSVNTLNMFEIHKYWNKIFYKDGYLHSKVHR